MMARRISACSATAKAEADTLLDLARRVRFLSPCRRDPEKFHCEKSEIEAVLRGLAQARSQIAGK